MVRSRTLLKAIRSTARLTVFLISLVFITALSAQQFVNTGQVLPGLYAGSAQWGFFDSNSSPDLLLTGMNNTGIPVTLVYQNTSGIMTLVSTTITGVYFGEAVWGDYDNDGDLDIVVVGLDNLGNSVAEIWKFEGGDYVLDTNQDMTGLRYATASWGDYNKDGYLDLVTTGMDRFGDSRTILYKNTKTGLRNLLIAETLQPLLNVSKGDAEFGDFDGDGDLDLVLSGLDASGFPNAALYKNDPVGFFSYDNSNSEIIKKLSNGSLAWIDVDADGDLDLMQTGLNARWESETHLYENEPVGRLRGDLLSAVQDVSGPFAIADLDNDGDLDITLGGKDKFSNLYGNLLEWSGGFTQNLLQFTSLRNGSMALGDFNSDGKLDLLVSGVNETHDFETLLFRNTSAGAPVTPGPPSALNQAVVTNNRIILTWDRGSDAQTPSNLLTYNVRIGTQLDESQILSGVSPVINGNVGNDLSLIMHTQLAEGTYTWSVQTVNAQLERSAWSQEDIFRVEQFVSSLQNIAGFRFASSAWGDYDNDGDPDFVIAGTDVNGDNRTLFYINNDGLLSEDRNVNNNMIQFNNGDFSWGDYDNDGDLDLAYTGFFIRESATSGIYVNDNGVLTEIKEPFTPVGFASLDWGDYDNDGDLDLAVMGKTSAGPFVTKIYNNDKGILTEDTGQSIMGYANGSLKWVDYDNDGDLDLSLTGQTANGDNRTRIYKNDPVGVLTEDSNLSGLPSYQSSDIIWLDLDDDGDLDMIITGFNDNTSNVKTAVFVNNPTGTLTEDAVLSANLKGVVGGSLTVGDYDNDGDPDLVVSGFDLLNPILKVYKNNATGFGEEFLTIIEDRGVDFSTISLIDIDGDGDLELVTTGRRKVDETTFISTSIVYDNVNARSNPNTAPQAVSGLISAVSGGTAALSWNPAVDFPIGDPLRDFVTYQIRIGTSPGGNEIISGVQTANIGTFGSLTSRVMLGLKSNDYYWSIRSVDNGLAASEWSLEETFRVDTDAPTVSSDFVTITPDSVGIGTATVFIVITENFDLDLQILPDVSVTLSNAAEAPVSILSYSGNTWIGEFDVLESYPSGSATLSVSGVTDAVGNVMTPANGIKEFLIDTDRPMVIITSPPFIEGGVQEGVGRNITLTATFGETINPVSVGDDVLKLFLGSQEVTAASNVQISSDLLSISALYSNLESETVYRAVVVSKVRDMVGNSMEGDFSWEFKTARIVSAQSGGSVSNADGTVTIYFSPNAISADAEISIEKATPTSFPSSINFINVAYSIGPAGGLTLNKPAQLRIGYDEESLLLKYQFKPKFDESKIVIYRQQIGNPMEWDKIGGTVNSADNTITASINSLGIFALFEDLGAGTVADGIFDISFSPRVFSPKGTTVLRKETGVNFTLGNAAEVTILIFNTSGRLVKRLLDNAALNSGRQTVVWNGRDGNGRVLPSGLYMVVIKSGSGSEMKTVAISNK